MKSKTRFQLLLGTIAVILIAFLVVGILIVNQNQNTDPAPFTPPEKPSVSPITVDLTADTVEKGGSVTTLSDGTSLLTVGKENSLSFTVNAEESGLYGVDLAYNIGNGYVAGVYLYNDSCPEWGAARGEGRLGASQYVPEPDMQDRHYRMSYSTYRQKCDGKYEMTVYLKKGENRLRFYIDGSQTNTKLGTNQIRFIPDTIILENAYTSLYMIPDFKTADASYTDTLSSGSSKTQNGYFLRGGSTVYMDLTVEEDGIYALTGLMSSYNAGLRISSVDGSFFPLEAELPPIRVGDASTSTLSRTIGTLNLKAGTHTVKIEVDGTYFHYNLLLLEKIAHYDTEYTVDTKQSNFTVDRKTGAFSLDLDIRAFDPNHTETKLNVVLDGSVQKADGTEESIKESYSLSGTVASASLFTEGREGYQKAEYTVSLYNAHDNSLVSEACHFTVYPEGEAFRAFLLTDTHYTGTNERIAMYNYTLEKYMDDKYVALKYTNSGYTGEYDIYGWTSDEKLQRIMDELIMKYKSGEIDMVFILGDVAMNDGNYANYNPDHVAYHTGRPQYFGVVPEGTDLSYAPEQSKVDKYGLSMDEFWNSPLNVSYLVREKFLNQLSEAGIPYYLANGNHDYQYTYDDDKTAIDYTAWETMYHYQELFGHRDAEGNYTDATPVDFLIRVIRRNGEIKILSALSTLELANFKNKNKDDGNCYDFYVSEDTLTEEDTLVTAFMMMNPHQIESYDFYMNYNVYYNLVTKQYSNIGQTVRPDYFLENIINKMADAAADYPSVHMLSHHIQNEEGLQKVVDEHPNIRGMYYGDVHSEERFDIAGLPAWVVGYFSADYDVDSYYVRDAETGDYARDENGNLIPDSQYYYDRGSPKLGNKIWGDTSRHPFCFVKLTVTDSYSTTERVHIGAYYEGGWQTSLTYDWVRGVDPNYSHATDKEKTAGTTFRDGNRTVYVGGDVATVGTGYFYIGASYKDGAYNTPLYMIYAMGNEQYRVLDLAGNTLESVANAKTTSLGARVTWNNETYYIVSRVGGVSGHYLYDENGDYVYRTTDGTLAYYDFLRDKEGNLIKEYYYLNENDVYVPLGEWQNGSYRLKDGIYTDIRLYKAGVDHNNQARGKYNVTSATIEIQNGVIVRGEGFVNFSYAHRFVDGFGNEILASSLQKDSDKTGLYIPKELYSTEWFMHD